MQIRVANRQDEPAIRAIVNQTRASNGKSEIDLVGADSDLNNIDAQYFWFDGIFIVAEEEGEIVGLAGARRGNSEETLELLRLAVSADWRDKGIEQQMLDTVKYFANNSAYSEIQQHVR
jgi:N-acetylglutamate synthase-like GNAT family acetyltransferase